MGRPPATCEARSQSEFVAMEQVAVEEVDGELLLSSGSHVDVVNG
jgi:hypothetical protein